MSLRCVQTARRCIGRVVTIKRWSKQLKTCFAVQVAGDQEIRVSGYQEIGVTIKIQPTISRKLILVFYLIFIIFVIFLNCIPFIQKKEWRDFVRVAVISRVDSVEIRGNKENTFYDNYKVTLNDTFPLYIHANKGSVCVNGVQYRGNLEIRTNAGQIWVINIVDIEDYLKGVVPCEIGRTSVNLIEATKAQAVAARTYAYAHFNQYQDLGFDLYATIKDQVYQGASAEHELTNLAIAQTRGEILIFRGLPIEAKYHSTCGGRTADFNDAWSGKAPPYLRSVACPYCKDSPYYRWVKKISKKEFFLNLRNRLEKIGITFSEGELIKAFKLQKNRKSERVNKIMITTTKNEHEIKTYNIRKVFGDPGDPGGLLKSNYITLKPEDDSIEISGRGYGHGVGMCQFGALEMAREGKSYKEILYHYYRGAKVIQK